jgi:hypothetical protein
MALFNNPLYGHFLERDWISVLGATNYNLIAPEVRGSDAAIAKSLKDTTSETTTISLHGAQGPGRASPCLWSNMKYSYKTY